MATPNATGSSLPSRYDEVLDLRMAEARKVLEHARTIESASPKKRWAGVALVLVCLVILASALSVPEPRTRGSVPFDRASVVSADTLGVATYAEDLVPPPPPAAVKAPPEPPIAEAVDGASTAPRRPRRPMPVPPPKDADDFDLVMADSLESGEDLLGGAPAVDIPALEEPEALTLNLGTRIDATLVGMVQTGPVAVPVSAALARDLELGGRIALPAGTMLVGEAFATRSDNRVQILFRAVVREGVTIPLQALALAADGQVGLLGSVVRKGTAAKKGLGHVLGAVGSALTLGAVGGDGPETIAADHLLGAGASRLAELEHTWSAERSDKAVRVPAGTRLVACLQADARIP